MSDFFLFNSQMEGIHFNKKNINSSTHIPSLNDNMLFRSKHKSN